MMPGDVPCEEPCQNRWCVYNEFGVCTDNAPCEDRTGDAEEGGEALKHGLKIMLEGEEYEQANS